MKLLEWRPCGGTGAGWELDGLEELQGIVVIAATNRPNLLDPALLRPGRFDELIYVPVPEEEGRLRILQIHTRNMPMADDVDLEEIARKTQGFTGADLENLVRKAGMQALRADPDVETIHMNVFEEALREPAPQLRLRWKKSMSGSRKSSSRNGPVCGRGSASP